MLGTQNENIIVRYKQRRRMADKLAEETQKLKLRQYKALITYIRALSLHYPIYVSFLTKYDQDIQNLRNGDSQRMGVTLRKLDRTMCKLTTKIPNTVRNVESLMKKKVQNKLLQLRLPIIRLQKSLLVGGDAQSQSQSQRSTLNSVTVSNTQKLLSEFRINKKNGHVDAIVRNVINVQKRYITYMGNIKAEAYLPTEFFTLPWQLYVIRDFYEDLFERRQKIASRLFTLNDDTFQNSFMIDQDIETIVILYMILEFYDDNVDNHTRISMIRKINDLVAILLHTYNISMDSPYNYEEKKKVVSFLGNDIQIYLSSFKVFKEVEDDDPLINYFRAFQSLLLAISDYASMLSDTSSSPERIVMSNHLEVVFKHEINTLVMMLSKPHDIPNQMMYKIDLHHFMVFVKELVETSKNHSMARILVEVPFYEQTFVKEMMSIFEYIKTNYSTLSNNIFIALLILLRKPFRESDTPKLFAIYETLVNRVEKQEKIFIEFMSNKMYSKDRRSKIQPDKVKFQSFDKVNRSYRRNDGLKNTPIKSKVKFVMKPRTSRLRTLDSKESGRYQQSMRNTTFQLPYSNRG